MATLYNVETHTINYHIKKIFADSDHGHTVAELIVGEQTAKKNIWDLQLG